MNPTFDSRLLPALEKSLLAAWNRKCRPYALYVNITVQRMGYWPEALEFYIDFSFGKAHVASLTYIEAGSQTYLGLEQTLIAHILKHRTQIERMAGE